MKAKNIVIEDGILDQIVVQAFTKQHFCCLCNLALSLSVHFKAGSTSKTKELCFPKMTHNILVHISKLATVTFVDDEYNLFISVRIHNFLILRTLNGICHFLHRCNDELPVLILHLLYKNIGTISNIYGASFKLVKLLGSLGIQVLSVHKKDDLFNIRVCRKNLGSLKRCQCLSCACCMPDIGVPVRKCCLTNKGLHGIYLIGAHNHQQLISVVQNGISREHLDDMITSKEGNGEVLQIGDTHIVKVRPEESKAIKHISVGVCKVFGINAIRDNKELDEVV